MNRGYIKLWRSSTDNPLYFSEPFTKWQAWVDLLILANHKRNEVDIRGILVTVETGQVLAGEEFLAKRWKWSRGKVRRFMSYLSSKTVQQIEQQKNNVCTVISITNWKHYQSNGTADRTADGTTDGQQTVQQTDIPKNEKNVENEKNTPQPHKGEPVDFDSFLDRFNTASGKKHRILDEKSKRQLRARIKDGFTVDEIITATKNCAADEYHRNNRKYLTPEFITRSDKLQKFLLTPTEPKKPFVHVKQVWRAIEGELKQVWLNHEGQTKEEYEAI